jgi:epoxide hydrolase-like protein
MIAMACSIGSPWLVRYWGTDYDWRRAEARLNALPQFVTEIDGLDIHFIHVFELLKVISPLTDPAAHGGSGRDAFHLVIPSLPGYGFSARPQGTGWNPDRIAHAWDTLMTRLATSATSRRAETGERSPPRRWDGKHRPGWPASTSTWPRQCRPTWRRHWPAPGQCQP